MLRTPSRIEILHLIQQHNKLNPTRSQQIPLCLSAGEEIRLAIIQEEQKLRKRSFNTVQRSAYSLRRCIEDVLKYNASTGDSSYDRETCLVATRDFLIKLEAEIEAVESLRKAVDKAKLLEDEQRETESATADVDKDGSAEKKEKENEHTAESAPRTTSKKENPQEGPGEDILKYVEGVIANTERKKSHQRRPPVLGMLPISSSSRNVCKTDSTTSITKLSMPAAENTASEPRQVKDSSESSQDMPEAIGPSKSANLEPVDQALAGPASPEIVKSTSTRRSSFDESSTKAAKAARQNVSISKPLLSLVLVNSRE